jgi:NitT/TauT family transport system permease protein
VSAQGRTPVLYAVSIAAGLVLWGLVSLRFNVTTFPSPLETWREAVRLTVSGEIFLHAWVSFYRLLIGFVIGCAIAIPIGLAMGVSPFVRRAMEPITEFFRFIPAIAMIVFALIWFGVNDKARIFLIVFATSFLVIIATEAGVRAVSETALRAAAMLGASRWQQFRYVVVPATVPYIVTGMRIAMGRSFMTIVAAEMLGASTGVGSLIASARDFTRLDTVMVGILTLALMGFLLDQAFQLLARRVAASYTGHVVGE